MGGKNHRRGTGEEMRGALGSKVLLVSVAYINRLFDIGPYSRGC